MSQKRVRLFCFPFAGGNEYCYKGLEPLLGDFDVETLALPGRGRLLAEPLLTDLEALAAKLASGMRIDSQRPYAFFGHSMGASLAYLTARNLLAATGVAPLALFLSARRGPSVAEERQRHRLSDSLFLEELRLLGGCPAEVLEDSDLMEFFLPILRADFQALETYRHQTAPPLQIPITVFAGSEDEVPETHLQAWQLETALPVDIRYYPGGHFYIYDNWPDIGDRMRDTLRRLM